MERIVFGISKINFEPNCEDVLTENRPPNFCATTLAAAATMASSMSFDNFSFTCPARVQNLTGLSFATATTTTTSTAASASSAATATTNSATTAASTNMYAAYPPADELSHKLKFQIAEASEEDEDNDGDYDCLPHSSNTTACFSQRRKMPSRLSKENSLLKIKRRSIMKPAKKTNDNTTLRPADIRKIYMTKSLTSFRPTNLETIFEEPQPEKRVSAASKMSIHSESSHSEISDHLRYVGIKKLKRSLSCSDGLNVNKTLMKQRRAKIKKTFGRRYALKKIALEDFLKHLNQSVQDEEGNNAAEATVQRVTEVTESGGLPIALAMDE